MFFKTLYRSFIKATVPAMLGDTRFYHPCGHNVSKTSTYSFSYSPDIVMHNLEIELAQKERDGLT